MSAMRTVHVPLGDRSYDVLVGHGARHELASLVPATVGSPQYINRASGNSIAAS